MNRVLMHCSAILSLVVLARSPAADENEVTIVGTVKEVSADGEIGGVLVNVDGKGEVYFLQRKKTLVSLPEGKGGKWSDLKVGQRVRITYGGILAASNPPQAGADRIVIEAGVKPKAKE
jgi:hypothetical protein